MNKLGYFINGLLVGVGGLYIELIMEGYLTFSKFHYVTLGFLVFAFLTNFKTFPDVKNQKITKEVRKWQTNLTR